MRGAHDVRSHPRSSVYPTQGSPAQRIRRGSACRHPPPAEQGQVGDHDHEDQIGGAEPDDAQHGPTQTQGEPRNPQQIPPVTAARAEDASRTWFVTRISTVERTTDTHTRTPLTRGSPPGSHPRAPTAARRGKPPGTRPPRVNVPGVIVGSQRRATSVSRKTTCGTRKTSTTAAAINPTPTNSRTSSRAKSGEES